MGFESKIFSVVLHCWAEDGQCRDVIMQLPMLAGSCGAARREVLPLLFLSCKA